jgi:hypothetical protein
LNVKVSMTRPRAGQCRGPKKYEAADLAPRATLNLSATLAFIDLQLGGYVKVER